MNENVVIALIAFLIGLAITIIGIIAWLRIFKKAGYSQLLGLLILIPVLNFIVLLFLGFKKWPIEEELEKLKENSANQLQ